MNYLGVELIAALKFKHWHGMEQVFIITINNIEQRVDPTVWLPSCEFHAVAQYKRPVGAEPTELTAIRRDVRAQEGETGAVHL